MTRSELMSSARSVFAEVGVRGATVSMICRRAGFTRGAFYSSFESKEDILFALMDEIATVETRVVHDGVGNFSGLNHGDWRLQLQQAFSAAAVGRESALFLIELQLEAVRSPGFGREYASFVRRFEREVESAMVEFATSAGLSLRIDSRHASRALFGLWMAAQTVAVAGTASLDANEYDESLRILAESLFVES